MARLALFVVGAGLVAYLGYRAMFRASATVPVAAETSAPKQQLDNVRRAAKNIEQQQQQAADDALEKAHEE